MKKNAECLIHREEAGVSVPAFTTIVLSYAKEQGPTPLCRECFDDYCRPAASERRYQSQIDYACGIRD